VFGAPYAGCSATPYFFAERLHRASVVGRERRKIVPFSLASVLHHRIADPGKNRRRPSVERHPAPSWWRRLESWHQRLDELGINPERQFRSAERRFQSRALTRSIAGAFDNGNVSSTPENSGDESAERPRPPSVDRTDHPGCELDCLGPNVLQTRPAVIRTID